MTTGSSVTNIVPDDVGIRIDNSVGRRGNFRWQGIQVFLTYPQVGDVSRETVIQHLENVGAVKYVIATEAHQDNGEHYHVLVKFAGKIHTRDCRFFDVGPLHPNIRSIRPGIQNLRRVYDYVSEHYRLSTHVAQLVTQVTKDGNFEGNFECPTGKTDRNAIFAEIIEDSIDRPSFLRKMKEVAPRDLIM